MKYDMLYKKTGRYRAVQRRVGAMTPRTRPPRQRGEGARGRKSPTGIEADKSPLTPILPVLSLVHQRGDAWANGKTSSLEPCLNIEQKSKSLEYLGIHI
jgi:hypothetical protein